MADDEETYHDEEDLDDLLEIENEPTKWSDVEVLEHLEEVKQKNLQLEESARQAAAQSKDIFEDPLGAWTRDRDRLSQQGRKRTTAILSLATKGSKDGSIDPNKEDFNPSLLLSVVHAASSYLDLKRGIGKVKKGVENQTQNLRDLVKDNLERFISCKDTIDEIYSRQSVKEGAKVELLEEAYKDLQTSAHSLFHPWLERKQKAEQIRTFLNLVSRFQFLFNLPSDIRESIDKGDHKRVVHDYKNAKYMMGSSSVPIFKKLMEEVETAVDKLRQMLFGYLRDPGRTEHHEQYIDHLYQLDAKTDPAWFYLTNRDVAVRTMFDDCIVVLERTLRTIMDRRQHRADQEERWRDLQEGRASGSMSGGMTFRNFFSQGSSGALTSRLASPQQVDPSASVSSVPSAVPIASSSLASTLSAAMKQSEELDTVISETTRIIRRLSTILSKNVPEFWRLGQMMLSGKFSSLNAASSSKAFSASSASALSTPRAPKSKITAEQREKEEQVFAMIRHMLEAYADKVRYLFHAIDTGDAYQPSLQQCVLEVSRCRHTLSDEVGIEAQNLIALSNLSDDLSKYYLDETIRRTLREISAMYAEEDFVLDPSLGRRSLHHSRSGPSPVTRLPLTFAEVVRSTLKDLCTVVTASGDSDASAPCALRVKFIENIESFVFNAARTFADCLHQLSFPHSALCDPQNGEAAFAALSLAGRGGVLAAASAAAETLANADSNSHSETTYGGGDSSGSSPYGQTMVEDRRLLVILGNCTYTRDVVLHEISDYFVDLFGELAATAGGSATADVDVVIELFEDLEGLVFDAFVRRKTFSSLAKRIRDGLALSGAEWRHLPRPSYVRPYARDLLLDLVAVHALVQRIDVYVSGSSSNSGTGILVSRGLTRLLEAIAELFLDYTRMCVLHLGENGRLQLEVELDLLQTTLRVFASDRSDRVFGEVRTYLDAVLEATQAYDEENGDLSPIADADFLGEPLSYGERERLKDDILERVQNQTRIEFECFTEA